MVLIYWFCLKFTFPPFSLNKLANPVQYHGRYRPRGKRGRGDPPCVKIFFKWCWSERSRGAFRTQNGFIGQGNRKCSLLSFSRLLSFFSLSYTSPGRLAHHTHVLGVVVFTYLPWALWASYTNRWRCKARDSPSYPQPLNSMWQLSVRWTSKTRHSLHPPPEVL